VNKDAFGPALQASPTTAAEPQRRNRGPARNRCVTARSIFQRTHLQLAGKPVPNRVVVVWHDRAVSDARLLAAEAVESHVRGFFEGHSVEVIICDLGLEQRDVPPDLRVLVVGPGPRSDSWAYVTAGCWAAMEKDGHGLELVMTAHVRDQRFIDLIAMIASYHCGGHQLEVSP